MSLTHHGGDSGRGGKRRKRGFFGYLLALRGSAFLSFAMDSSCVKHPQRLNMRRGFGHSRKVVKVVLSAASLLLVLASPAFARGAGLQRGLRQLSPLRGGMGKRAIPDDDLPE